MHENYMSKRTAKAQSEIDALKQRITQLEAEAGRAVDLNDPEGSASKIVDAEYQAKKLKLILNAKETSLIPLLTADYTEALKAIGEQEGDFNKQLSDLDKKIKQHEATITVLKTESAAIQRQRTGIQYQKKSLSDELEKLTGAPVHDPGKRDISKTVDPRRSPRPLLPAKPRDLNLITPDEIKRERSLNFQ